MRAIGPLLTLDERAAYIAAARSCLGVPFRHQGRSRTGMDCAGLAGFCMVAIGRPYMNIPVYSREPLEVGPTLHDALVENLGDPLPRDQMQVGDIVSMRFKGEPSHVAIVVDHADYPFGLVHAYGRKRKVVEHGMDDVWFNRIVEVYRP